MEKAEATFLQQACGVYMLTVLTFCSKIFKERVKIPAGLPIAKVIGTKGASFKPLTKITECGIKVLKEERAVSIADKI